MSTYTFQVEVTGRELGIDEVKSLGLVDDDAIRRFRKSDYMYSWYEVKAGDHITVRASKNEEEGIDEIEEFVFEVPGIPFPVLPQKLDDTFTIDLVTCLQEHCKRIK